MTDLSAVDSVVRCEMEIINICRDYEILGNIVEFCVFWRSKHLYVTENLSLFYGVCRPCACVDVCSLFLKQVEGHHAELQTCTATKEKNMVVFREMEELLCQCYSLIHYSLELFATVGDFKDWETHIWEILDSFRSFLNCVRAQDAGSCIKIVFLHDFNGKIYMVCICWQI